MNTYASIHLDKGDEVRALIIDVADRKRLRVDFGWTGHLYVPTDHELYGPLCKAFGLTEETAPGDETEDGVPGGNEPTQEMVPQIVGD